MKPDWKDAPEWAQWLAQNENGEWYWYKEKPGILRGECRWETYSNCRKRCEIKVDEWKNTLERRPKMKYRKKPVVIEATQWFKNGDHPLDYTDTDPQNMSAQYRKRENWEGEVVRYYRRPNDNGERICEQCGKSMHEHGWIDTFEGGHNVCPGDWIITGIKGEHYPCKPDIFEATYEECIE